MIKERDPEYYFKQMWEHERRMHPNCKACRGKN